ncbi:MAG: class I SAM-dependent methyltransferase [Sedimentisphaerales bacterium]|nr:class I SAM-dependent methyltransferase [Sedimentisphaerales bacterium]
MADPQVPKPDVMPVDRAKWAGQVYLSNFVNSYYQYRDLQRWPQVRSVLIVGPGQGLSEQILRWKGYRITTLDIDAEFSPDVVGSVHEMTMFTDRQFDAVIASHVLEHLAEPYLNPSLREIARVGNHAIISLPIAGRHFQIRCKADIKGLDRSVIVDLFNVFHRPDGVTPRYSQGQHFWEVGMRGFRKKDLLRRISCFFEIVKVYRNPDWNPSMTFLLHSRFSKRSLG